MRKKYLLIFSLILCLIIFPLFAQTKPDPWKVLLNNEWDLAKNIFLSQEDYLSHIGLSIMEILEDNPQNSWDHWERAINLNPISFWHNIIGLLGKDYWQDLGKTSYFAKLLGEFRERADYLDFLYWKGLNSIWDIERLHDFIKEKGIISDWMIIGPFDNVGNSGFYKEYPPEKEINFEKSYIGKGGIEVKWFSPKFSPKNGYVNLYNLFYHTEWSVAYALNYIYIPKNLEVLINIGSSDSISLWIDDYPCLREDAKRSSFFGQNILRVKLSEGWHKFLLKVASSDGDWGFFFSLLDSSKKPIDGIKVSKEPQNYPKKILDFKEENPELSLAKEISYMPAYYTFAGYFLTEKGLYSKAENLLNMALKIIPDSAITKYFLGRLYLKIGKEEEGKRLISEAVEKIPFLSEAYTYLAFYSYSFGRYEESISYLKNALNINPNAFFARDILARIYLSKRWLKEADEQIKFFEAKYKDSLLKDYLRGRWYEALKQYNNALEKYGSIIEKDKEYNEGLYAYYYLAKNLGKWEISENILNFLEEKDPWDVWAYLEKADILIAKDEKEKALELISSSIDISPYYPELYYTLGDILHLKGEKDKAIENYEKALDLEPGYQNLREYLSYLREETISPPDISSCLKQQIPIEYSDFPAVILLDEQRRIVHKDGSCTNVYHSIIKVQNDKGKERYGEFTIDYDSSFESVRILRARTIKPNGEELEAVSIKDYAVFEDYPLYTDQRQIVISMPGLEPGAIIECFYIVEEYTRSVLGKEFQDVHFFQWQDPILLSRYQLKVPQNISFRYRTYNVNLEPKIEKEGEYVTYTWEYKNVPPLIPEPYMPYYANLLAQLWITTYKDWDTLADWVAGISYPQMRPNKAIEDKVKELTENKKTRLEKIKAIYYYVISQIRYVGLEYGIRGLLPHQAEEIFKVKYGDCKDKSVLLITMLRLAGIESYYTLVNTKFSTSLKKELPGFQFDHAICAVPMGKDFLFLDGTAEDTPLGEVPIMDQGCDAMIIKDDGSYIFTTIPQSKPEDNKRAYKVYLNVDEEGVLEGDVDIEYRGIFAVYTRWNYKSSSSIEKEESLIESLNYKFPGSSLTKWSMDNLDDLDSSVYVKLTFKNNKYVKKDNIYLNPVIFTPLTSAVEVSKPERRYPINYHYPYEENEEVEIRIDESFSISSLPKDISIKSPWVTYERKVEKEGNIVRIKRVFRLEKTEIPLEEYKSYKEVMEQILKLDQEVIIGSKRK
ncbi:MAG: hypothetical protein CBR30_05500 [Dictyoglomus sp. NZ13-RE01]|nr:MAG: hypothetical protein CBR30_05500 [Dictyoglomus sp. NZ13-RE01]